jgi:hypothetical protein
MPLRERQSDSKVNIYRLGKEAFPRRKDKQLFKGREKECKISKLQTFTITYE